MFHQKKKLRRGRKKKLQRGQKKLKTYDLSSLSEFLPELKAPQQPTPETEFNLNCKSRQKLMWALQFLDLHAVAQISFSPNMVFKSVWCNNGSLSSAWRKENSWVQFLTILLSSRILWLPFINTCRAHNRLQMRNQRKTKTKMEGRREKRRRSLRFQMGLNLWLCDLKDKLYHSPLRRICSNQILKDSNAHIWNVGYALLVNKSNCGYLFSVL